MKLGENRRFSNTCQLFSFLAKLNFLKDSFTTTLYLLDFIGFSPTFGLFHYANLPSYKRVRGGRLAGPFHTSKIIINIISIHSLNTQILVNILVSFGSQEQCFNTIVYFRYLYFVGLKHSYNLELWLEHV